MHVMTLLAALVVLPTAARAATCEETSSVSQLSEAGAAAEEAFANLDAETLLSQASIARTVILPCVSEVLTKHDAAAFHRLMAMEAYFNNNGTRTVQEFHAALMLEPGYEFPTDVVDPNHPLLELYKSAETAPDGEGEKIYPPPGGYVLVGGVRNAARYSQTPVIMQVFDASGILRETRYVQPGEASPNWSGNAFGLTAQDLGINMDELARPSILTKPTPWYIAASSTALASGVLYGLAMHQKGLYQDPSTPDDQLGGLESSANGLGTASLITGGSTVVFIGLGLGFQFGGPGQNPTLSPGQELAYEWH